VLALLFIVAGALIVAFTTLNLVGYILIGIGLFLILLAVGAAVLAIALAAKGTTRMAPKDWTRTRPRRRL
jgi:hypothetical protein